VNIGNVWSVEPSRGPTRGGTAVTVRGVEGAEGFESVFCMFGEDGVAGIVQNDGSIICRSPRSRQLSAAAKLVL